MPDNKKLDPIVESIMSGGIIANPSYNPKTKKGREQPQYIQQTAKAGAMLMCVHYEACPHIHRVIQEIHNAGMKAGVAINPGSPVEVLQDIIEDVELVLIMSVNPGFGGQKFISNALNKVSRLRQMIDNSNSKAVIEVDGGVQGDNAKLLVDAGADVLVSGSYIFNAPNPLEAISQLKEIER